MERSDTKDRQHRRYGLLRRLASDTGGNTLAIIGASFIPLAMMIGSGVDMSRAYMAKTRLQSACDAASLAARRVMSNDELTQAVKDEGVRFFNFNFQQKTYQTATFTPQVTKPSTGTVKVAASTTIPTTIMALWGFKSLPLNVECEASQNFVNTDVVLVLDTTGSMLDSVSGGQKIVALREAVMALYDELKPIQDELQANGMRLRYGLVPYSSTVNVGAAIRAQSPDYLANSWTYQTRTAIYSTSSNPIRVGNSLSNSQCNNYRQSRTPSDGYPAVEKTVSRPGSGTYRPCDVTTTTYQAGGGEEFAWWHHGPWVVDTAQFKTGSSNVRLPTQLANQNAKAPTWSGCIEERDTTDDITGSSGYNIPAAAWDLNIDHIPNSEATRWKPHWPEIVYDRSTSSEYTNYTSTNDSNSLRFMTRYTPSQGYYACPTRAERLKTWTRGEMQSYVDDLEAVGGTYHDIGMIWGGRLISAQGIFGADNPETYNGMPVNKHIIFMTDGQLAPNASLYGAYGIEDLDKRITGSSNASGQYERHEQRFKMMCNQIKGKNVSLWVVAFDTEVSGALNTCASNSNQVSVSTNKQQLIDKFKEIGKNIGALRLTQ